MNDLSDLIVKNLDYDIAQKFTCNYCKIIPDVNLKICNKSDFHIICRKCQTDDNCRLCESKLINPNSTIISIFNRLLYYCEFYKKGCVKTKIANQIEFHSKICEFNPQNKIKTCFICKKDYEKLSFHKHCHNYKIGCRKYFQSNPEFKYHENNCIFKIAENKIAHLEKKINDLYYENNHVKRKYEDMNDSVFEYANKRQNYYYDKY